MTIAIVCVLQDGFDCEWGSDSAQIGVSWTLLCHVALSMRMMMMMILAMKTIMTESNWSHLNNCKSVPRTEFFQLRDDKARLYQRQFGLSWPHTVCLQCVFRHICKTHFCIILQVLFPVKSLCGYSPWTLYIYYKPSFNFNSSLDRIWEVSKNTWDILTDFGQTPVSV